VGFGFSSIAPSNTSIAQTVWSYGPRTLTDIQSLVNAIQNNNPNLLSTLSDLPFIPAPMYAGQVSLTQVASFISNLVQNYNAAGVIASFINSNPYSLWHMDFVTNLIQNPYLGFTNASLILSAASTSALASIAISTNVPVTTILALISNSALSADAAQGLLYGLAENYYYNKWIDLVTYNAPTSVTFSTNTVISTNVLIAQNITIASGVTVTCGTTTCFFVAQVFNNQGTIVNPYGAPGGGGGSGGGGGGAGGGGVVIVAYTAAIGTVNVNGGVGGTAYVHTGSGGYTPYGGGNGKFAVVSGISVPIGGNGATTGTSTPGGDGEPNAGGGGAADYYWGGNGGSATVYSFTDGNALITYVIQGISDWWLSNVIGKAPSPATPLLYVYGSGGGGGGGVGGSGYYGGGGGGGGGGEVIVFGDEVTAGTIDAVGGTGGYNPGGYGGGGGGGGGIVLIFYGPGGLNGTMSLDLAGGGTGLSTNTSWSGAAGQTGVYLATSVTVNG
jgi:hypothetical protein